MKSSFPTAWVALLFIAANAVPGALASGGAQLAMMNNDAVKLMSSGKLQEAKAKLEAVLAKDSSYTYAKENYAICLNNIALKSSPQRAWTELHHSYYVNPSPETRVNMYRVLQAMKGKATFESHMSLAEKAYLANDFPTAVVEYEEALKVKRTPEAETALANAKAHVPEFWRNLRGEAPTPKPWVSQVAAPRQKSGPDVDFGPYMTKLQRQIKKAWFPPKGNESKRVVVVFKVTPDGKLSGAPKIEHSSGVAAADKAALQAIQNAAPYEHLPKGANQAVDIQFSFDYNVYKEQSSAKTATRPTTADLETAKFKSESQAPRTHHDPPKIRKRHGKSKGD